MGETATRLPSKARQFVDKYILRKKKPVVISAPIRQDPPPELNRVFPAKPLPPVPQTKDKGAYQTARGKLASDEKAVARIGDDPEALKKLRVAVEQLAASQKLLTDDAKWTDALSALPAYKDAVDAAIAARRKAMETATQLQVDECNKLLDKVTAKNKKKAWADVGSPEWEKAVGKILELRLDDDFTDRYDETCAQVADDLANDPVIQEAHKEWKTWTKDEQSLKDNKDKLEGTMKQVIALQSKRLGIDPPTPVETYIDTKKPGSYGGFDGSKKKISLNLGTATIDDFREMLDTLTHENTHAYQRKLLEAKQAGTLKPGEPDYNAAVMFELNTNKGYVTSSESDQYPGKGAYEQQIKEVHAWRAGAKAGKAAYDLLETQGN